MEYFWNKSTLAGTKVTPHRYKACKHKGGEEERWWKAPVLGVNGESCLCGNALGLASEASNGALWMGSYLQGFSFNLIRKRAAAALGLFYWTESFKAVPTRLGGKTCRREVELATCDSRPAMTPAAATAAHGQASARGMAESSFSMHVTCINDAEWCVFSPCRMLVLLRKRHVQKWSLQWRSGWNETKWNGWGGKKGNRKQASNSRLHLFHFRL